MLAIHEHISNHNPIDALSGLEWLQSCDLCRLSHSPQPVSVGRKNGMRTKLSNNNKSGYKLWVWLWLYHIISVIKAMLAQKPSTSWRVSTFIACISTEDSVGKVYPIFASLVTHAMTSYFCATVCWGAFIPISEICRTPLPILAAMEKSIRHWINGPLSTWKVWTTTS